MKVLSLALFERLGKRNGRFWLLCILLSISLSCTPSPSTTTASPVEQDKNELSATEKLDNSSINRFVESLRAKIIWGRGIQRLWRGQYSEALTTLQTALEIFQRIGDRTYEGRTLNALGFTYWMMGEHQIAANYFDQGWEIAIETGDRHGEADALNGLALVHRYQGDYQQAIDVLEQQLTLTRDIGYREGEGRGLGVLGILYWDLGQYPRAVRLLEERLEIAREIGDRHGEMAAHNGLGLVYRAMEEYETAILNAEQMLALSRRFRERNAEGRALGTLGLSYLDLGRHQEALDYFQQRLTIAQDIGDQNGQVNGLYLSGLSYHALGNESEAVEHYQAALAIAQEQEMLPAVGAIFAGLGRALVAQGQPELAIPMLKASVIAREKIRNNIQGLPETEQQIYTDTVADDYRFLADLLIEQGRLSEAQQVLDLLKLQELREFTRNGEVTGNISQIPLADIEQAILDEFITVSNFTLRLAQCEQTQCDRLTELKDLLDSRTTEFQEEVEEFRKTLRERLAQDLLITPDQLNKTAREIVTAEPGTVLVYPVVLEDKIRLLLAIRARDSGVIFRDFETDIDQETLWRTVFELREHISTTNGGVPVHDAEVVQSNASTLYQWLIQPLKPELEQLAAQENLESLHLVFALDRQTRYIPMAVLFDAAAQEYLIEQHAVSTVLSADLTDVSRRLSPLREETPTLAVGVAQAIDEFPALRFVPSEVDAVVQRIDDPTDARGAYPGQQFLDEQFVYSVLRDNLAGNRILHIATHARFEPGIPQNSFLLSGEGELRIDRIEQLGNYGMADVDLVVLSACETARGGPDESGIEIPGISYYFLGNGAAAVMASLWLVNDCSTSLLMERFYENLSQGDVTKAEALRQAQLSLLNQEVDAVEDCRDRMFEVAPRDGEVAPQPPADGYAHPYYWAPFILIGNGL